MAKPKTKSAPFPSKEEVLAFIRESPATVGKREIARAFHIKGSDRIALKALLKELERDGLLERQAKRKLSPRGRLPSVLVIEVTGTDPDGELLARPAAWDQEEAPPVIYLSPGRRSRAALAVGDRVLARLKQIDKRSYEAETIRRIVHVADKVLGIYQHSDEGGADLGRLRPVDKRAKKDFILRAGDAAGAKVGELVLAELKPGRPRLGLREVRVVECLGQVDSPKALSLIAIHEHELPVSFSAEALAEAEAAGPIALGRRVDLRAIPLVTIDGADARDFDDAVWAEADSDPANEGGWHILVAIADVAAYVRPDSALDRAAYARGNSAYFPDRVVPMLPEVLSNGWCSLKPDEERPCLTVDLWIDKAGQPRRHRFQRGLMRSVARLTYEQVQAAYDGQADDLTAPLLENVIAPLYGAFTALLKDRSQRGTLELDLPERQVVFNDAGEVVAIEARRRLDSHRLIEEFMIAANVAAAKQIESTRQPCMYRVHDAPDPVKIEALRQVLRSIDVKLARGQAIRPAVFTRIIEQVNGGPYSALVNGLILRSQSQAAYGPDNIGHFGLALGHYAHFTSPIRRYADLLVHRALISGLKLSDTKSGEDGLSPDAGERFRDIGDHISTTERRAASAERDAVDRFTAAFLRERLGDIFAGRINGVTRFGLFVTLDENGADGLVPISSLPDDFYDHIEAEHSLVGRRWGRTYRLGDQVWARLREANPVTGGIILELVESDDDNPEKTVRNRNNVAAKPRRKEPKIARLSQNRARKAKKDGNRRKLTKH